MPREKFCAENNVRLVAKSELRLMRFAAWLLSLLPRYRRPVGPVKLASGTQVVTADGEWFTVVRRSRGFFDYDVVGRDGAHGSITVQMAEELVDRGAEFLRRYWTTYKLLFCKTVIAYPDGIDPMRVEYDDVRNHELGHVVQWKLPLAVVWMPALYFIFPLPIVLSGRWYVERRPYLVDLRAGVLTLEQAAERLWAVYVMAWPRRWAVAWWKRELERDWNF